jgi:hypothetical protein
MALDAGTFVWSVPVQGQATEAATAIAGNVTTTGVKAAFVASQPTDVYEVGAVIGTATAATTYTFTVAVDEKIGGTLSTTGSNFATVTGPAGAAITGGFTLKKAVKMRVPKGGCLVFNVTSAPASGTAQLYAICAVAGAPAIGAQAAAGGLGTASPPVPNEILSTT